VYTTQSFAEELIVIGLLLDEGDHLGTVEGN
jgi:hypothetical protein